MRARWPNLLAVAASFMLSAYMCLPAQPAVVNIKFNNYQVVLDNTLDAAGLGKFEVNTQYAKFHDTFTRGGLRLGTDFSPQFVVTFGVDRDPVTANTCLFPTTIDISIDYKPLIYIAREYAPQSCRYQVISQHEMKHVNTDIIAFTELLPGMKDAVLKGLAAMGAVGPLRDSQIMQGRDRVTDVVEKALQASVKKIEGEIFKRQQLIDSRDEYLRVSHACPNDPVVLPPGYQILPEGH